MLCSRICQGVLSFISGSCNLFATTFPPLEAFFISSGLQLVALIKSTPTITRAPLTLWHRSNLVQIKSNFNSLRQLFSIFSLPWEERGGENNFVIKMTESKTIFNFNENWKSEVFPKIIINGRNIFHFPASFPPAAFFYYIKINRKLNKFWFKWRKWYLGGECCAAKK